MLKRNPMEIKHKMRINLDLQRNRINNLILIIFLCRVVIAQLIKSKK
jgi:hypothetical protein